MRIERSQLFLFLLLFTTTSVYDVMKCNCAGSNCNGPTNSHKNHKRLFPGWYPDFVDAIVEDSIKDKRANDNVTNPKITASNIAQKAAKEAVAASEAQNAAGQAASKQVKSQLAEKALQAARAAEAALAGKQQIVDELFHQVSEAQTVLEEATNSLQNSRNSEQTSRKLVEQIRRQIKILIESVRIAQSNVANAEQAASGVQAELNEKIQLVEAAKRRLKILMSDLSKARDDFMRTKQAAYKAACAAHEAKMNAQNMRRRNVNKRYDQFDSDAKSNMKNLNPFHHKLVPSNYLQ